MFMRAKIRLFSEISKCAKRTIQNSKLKSSKLSYTIACTPSVLSTAVAMAMISFRIVFQVSLFILFMVLRLISIISSVCSIKP